MTTTLTDTFSKFVRSEQFGGVMLILCTLLSLALANSTLGASYQAVWQVSLGPLSLEHWINDALMAVFFLLIGLELERELYVGELSAPRKAILPVLAALGGMLAPAAIHFALNGGTPESRGFGIPMATDIAFALGVLALAGPSIPAALKIFIVAFAVIDDLGAIILIATVYTAELAWGYLGLAALVFAALWLLNRRQVMWLWPYLLGGVLLWAFILNAGVHASIAGVLLAFAIPFRAREGGSDSPSHRLEHLLHRPVAFVILPLFALANTGITIDSATLSSLASNNSIGIALGLILGKPIGILLFAALAVRLGVCSLPDGVRWGHVVGAGMLGGIGFTMSIFITNLAFAGAPTLIDSSKLAVLCASTLAGLVAFAWLRMPASR
jgi:Na+:H+ antiporter, NhaA family